MALVSVLKSDLTCASRGALHRQAVSVPLKLKVDRMEVIAIIEKILNNQSFGAFLGAFSAFLLVVLNDWRRERQKVRTIKAEFQVCLSHSNAKLETVRRRLYLARQHNRVSSAPVMPFNVTIIRQITAEAIDRLTLEQRRAIDAMCYRMEAADGVLLEIYQIAQKFSDSLEQADRMRLAERIVINFKDAVVNLKILNVMLIKYIEADYHAVASSKFDRDQFEEP